MSAQTCSDAPSEVSASGRRPSAATASSVRASAATRSKMGREVSEKASPVLPTNGVDAEPEGEGQDREGGEGGAAAKRTERVAEVVAEPVHRERRRVGPRGCSDL
jgi:hypothetical protein